MKTLKDRYRGSFLGLAVGDAVGTTLESTNFDNSNGTLTDMIGGGKFSLLPGQWTDDTSMSLCLAESLLESKGFSPSDQLKRYLRWYREGYRSSNGQCFDIGITTRMALEKFEKKQEDYPASSGDLARAGNGSLMRICPIPLFYRKTPHIAMEKAKDSSRTTHGAAPCIDACRYFTGILLGILEGESKEKVLSSRYYPESLGKDYYEKFPLAEDIDEVANGSFKTRQPPEIRAAGHVTRTLEAVLWAFYHTDNFKDGLLKVVNLGGDSDTTGAIFGQIGGAFYGESSIPDEWKHKIAVYPLLDVVIDELLAASDHVTLESENHFEISKEYKIIHENYQILEDGYRDIIRKLLPGIHAYKAMSAFEKDVADLEALYISKAPSDSVFKEILADFKRRFEDDKIKLQTKLARPNPFAALKKD